MPYKCKKCYCFSPISIVMVGKADGKYEGCEILIDR